MDPKNLTKFEQQELEKHKAKMNEDFWSSQDLSERKESARKIMDQKLKDQAFYQTEKGAIQGKELKEHKQEEDLIRNNLLILMKKQEEARKKSQEALKKVQTSNSSQVTSTPPSNSTPTYSNPVVYQTTYKSTNVVSFTEQNELDELDNIMSALSTGPSHTETPIYSYSSEENIQTFTPESTNQHETTLEDEGSKSFTETAPENIAQYGSENVSVEVIENAADELSSNGIKALQLLRVKSVEEFNPSEFVSTVRDFVKAVNEIGGFKVEEITSHLISTTVSFIRTMNTDPDFSMLQFEQHISIVSKALNDCLLALKM